MRKLTEAELNEALATFNAAIRGWSNCTKIELDVKVEKAWVEINKLKAQNGPWKKAKADVMPVMARWQALGGLPESLVHAGVS